MYRNKKVGIIGIIITVLILIILVFTTTVNVNKFSKAEGFFNKLVMPIQNGLTYLKNKISGNNSFFENIDNLKSENEKLIAENNKLQEKKLVNDYVECNNFEIKIDFDKVKIYYYDKICTM